MHILAHHLHSCASSDRLIAGFKVDSSVLVICDSQQTNNLKPNLKTELNLFHASETIILMRQVLLSLPLLNLANFQCILFMCIYVK
jgi:hypothetical protein